jgi:two-component sensor histidine kinase/tetratricopeptide (TPR) repeat protein
MKNTFIILCILIGSFNSSIASQLDSSIIYLNRADSALAIYDFSKATYFTKQSIRFKNKREESNLGNEYLKLGIIFNKFGLLDSALYYLEKSEKSFLISKNKSEIGITKLEIGRVTNKQSNYIRAFTEIGNAILIFESLNDSLRIATAKLNLGNIYKKLGKFNESLNHYKESIRIYSDLKLNNRIGDCYNNMAILYLDKNEPDSSLRYFKKCINVRDSNGKKIKTAYVYTNLANLFVHKNQLDSALFYTDKSIKLKLTLSYKNLLDEYYTLGDIYFKKQDFKNSLYYYKLALELSEEQNIFENKKELHKTIGKTYYKLNNFNRSAFHFENSIFLEDSLKKMNPEIEIEARFTNYEFIKDSLKNKQLVLQKEIADAEMTNIELNTILNKSKINYFISLLCIVTILGGLLFFSSRKRLAESRKHQEILAEQNRELKRTLISKEEKEVLLKEVHHRVKNNLQIINSLVRLQSNYMTPNNYRQKLIETENRIRSMALVHEKLYQSNELSKLNAKSYIIDLVENIKASFSFEKPIDIIYNFDKIECSIDSLIPLGLIINETISNSIKYAFEGKELGRIEISLKIDSENQNTLLTIKDNGIGADLSYDELSEDSLGMELIESLCEQLDGDFVLNTDNGFEYNFIFPELI